MCLRQPNQSKVMVVLWFGLYSTKLWSLLDSFHNIRSFAHSRFHVADVALWGGHYSLVEKVKSHVVLVEVTKPRDNIACTTEKHKRERPLTERTQATQVVEKNASFVRIKVPKTINTNFNHLRPKRKLVESEGCPGMSTLRQNDILSDTSSRN